MIATTIPEYWYYLLSTIAQTCGAILAIAGAYTIFKLEKVDSGISNYHSRLSRILFEIDSVNFPLSAHFNRPSEILSDFKNAWTKDSWEKLIRSDWVTNKGNNTIRNEMGVSNTDDRSKPTQELVNNWVERMKICYTYNKETRSTILDRLSKVLWLLTLSIILSIYYLMIATQIPSRYIIELITLFSLFSIADSVYHAWKIVVAEVYY